MDLQRIALLLAERVREIATRQGNVPFRTGDLRKSHVVHPLGGDSAEVGSNLPYARAVHDGRPRVVIKPRRKKALFWPGAAHPVKKVVQPPRQGNPWLLRAVEALTREGAAAIAPMIGDDVAAQLTRALRAKGLKVTRGKT